LDVHDGIATFLNILVQNLHALIGVIISLNQIIQSNHWAWYCLTFILQFSLFCSFLQFGFLRFSSSNFT
jgi:hypothetical protein